MSYKEIVTKAIIGKGKKYFKNNYTLETQEQASTVLGCWVINHKFKGYKKNDKIGVSGSFDINIWYSYDNNSKTQVINKTIEYEDEFNVKVKENTELESDSDIIVRSLQHPKCSKVSIDGMSISFDIEKELGVELIGETKVKIAIEDSEDPWDEIIDDVDLESLKEIDNVQDDYIK